MLRLQRVKGDKEMSKLEELFDNTISVDTRTDGSITRLEFRLPGKPLVIITSNFSDLVVDVQREIIEYSLKWTRNIDGFDIDFSKYFESESERLEYISTELSDLPEDSVKLDTISTYNLEGESK